MNKNRIKENILISGISIIIFALVFNISAVLKQLNWVVSLLTPFIVAFGISFVLNRPYMFIKKKIFNKIFVKFKKSGSISNIFSILATYLLFFIVLALLISFFIPQLAASVTTLINNIPQYQQGLETLYQDIVEFLNLNAESDIVNSIVDFWSDITSKIGDFISKVLPHIFNITVNITTGITNFFLGLIISVYMLANKNTLITKIKKLFYAFIPTKYSGKLMETFRFTNKVFSSFIVGQLIDALIVGILCFIGMQLLDMPYALLISVIIAVTNVIPMFGPFIGAIPSTLIILMVDPVKAIWFIVFIVVLQQIDGNIIIPRIVSNSLGISGIMVIFALLVGGGLFGILGMIVGLPAFAVIYSIFKEIINNRLEKKRQYIDDIDDKIKLLDN